MLLAEAQVLAFRSIDDSLIVPVDPKVTVLVGQNESGKTAFLQALYKARPTEDDERYDVIQDYPRKNLNAYEKRHKTSPDVVCKLTYVLTKAEVDKVNQALGATVLTEGFRFTLNHTYDNEFTITLSVSEAAYISDVIGKSALPDDLKKEVKQLATIREVIEKLQAADLNETAKQFFDDFNSRFDSKATNWKSLLGLKIWKEHLSPRIPKFLYFDDYRLLPGKVNLAALQQAIQVHKTNKQPLREEDKTVLSLLRMAGVTHEELTSTTSYENIKAKLEGISNTITDQVFQYWKQNTELDVEFDIRTDAQDIAPYNNGNNLYIRIRNRRHRVTVPFSQRSKGFIWFFSFIVWFDSIREQLQTTDDLILLLDEPGLSLHALAQADFLDYIDDLSTKHQVIYTTHSPFMVRNDRLVQARAVEDKAKEGTRISANISTSDPKTLFPLQAALGYTIAQNLFVGKRNLLVEGTSDLVYLQHMSVLLEMKGKAGLRDDVTIVPVGGLDKLSTFIALLGANKLELVTLHDYRGTSDPHLESLVKEKLIKDKNIHHFGMYRGSSGSTPTDVEDLLTESLYLDLFNKAYAAKLPKPIAYGDLPAGDRIIARIEAYLLAKGVKVRPSGGFNHHLPAQTLATDGGIAVDDATLSRFEQMFKAINKLYS